jgi:hypothetical protein
MTVQTSTGMQFAIVNGVPATVDQAGFAALTYENVGEVVDIAEIGADVTVVTHLPLATGIVEKLKGFTNFGSSSVSFGRDITDAGQIALKSAAQGANKNNQQSVEITSQDGTKDYFICKIFSYKFTPGSADSIVSATSAIEIESEIIEG